MKWVSLSSGWLLDGDSVALTKIKRKLIQITSSIIRKCLKNGYSTSLMPIGIMNWPAKTNIKGNPVGSDVQLCSV